MSKPTTGVCLHPHRPSAFRERILACVLLVALLTLTWGSLCWLPVSSVQACGRMRWDPVSVLAVGSGLGVK